MKHLLFLILMVLSLNSCKKDSLNELFTMRYELSFTIPAGANTIETHKFRFPQVQNKLSTLLENTGIDKSRIDKIEPGLAEFVPVFNDFNIATLREVTINMFDLDDSSILQEIEFNDQIPLRENTESLKLVGSLGEITPIVLNDERFGIQIELDLRQIPVRDYQCRVIFDIVAFEQF